MPPTLKPLLCLAVLALAIAPRPALGQTRPLEDQAEMFSKEAVADANGSLARIAREYGQSVMIETVETLGGAGIDEFATRRAEQMGHKGIFILIAKKERKIDVLAAPRAFRESLGIARLNTIRDAMTEQFGKGQVDAGLTKGIEAAETALAAIRPTRRFDGSPADPATTTTKTTVTGPVATPASGNSPLVLRQQVRLTLAGARQAIAGAEAKAAEKGYKMNIAAVDDGGHLLAFARMDGARPASVATATTKAVTAATFRQPSGPLPVGKEPDLLLNLSLQNATGGKITTLPGGIPIVVDGQVIGALGVGGGSGEQDAEVARAGVDAFVARLQEGARDR